MSTTNSSTNEVKGNDVVLFMKGTPQQPMCGFSGQACQMLAFGVSYKGLNVLDSDELRNGIRPIRTGRPSPSFTSKANSSAAVNSYGKCSSRRTRKPAHRKGLGR